MSGRPLVTVVTTTYNWPSVLRVAMESVLAQGFRDFEYLVVGDCCTDGTEALVASFKDPRIRWHNLAQNTGNQSGPNRVALEMARGRYIAYLNHDDIWFPNHLELLTTAMQANEADILFSLCLEIAPPGSMYRAVAGLPYTHPLGKEHGRLVTAVTSSIMHPLEAGLAIGNWRDWRTLQQTPPLDFIERLMRHRGRRGSVKAVTVLKFNSADRANCYRLQSAEEQTRYWDLVRNDPGLLARELLGVIECQMAGIGPPLLPQEPPPAEPPPGWQIAQWRRMRGLDPI
jgi:glycosyltransferase involved in cell wall biosynthesis